MTMTLTIRDLIHGDQEEVNILCSPIWGGKDYVPKALPNWIDAESVIVKGRFDGKELVCICALEIQDTGKTAYISGLRTKTNRLREGHGKHLVSHLVCLAAKLGIERIMYIASSDNHPSIGLARLLGFTLLDQVHFCHLSSPFPAYPSPSDASEVVAVTPEHLAVILEHYPLVPSQHVPYCHGLHPKTIEDLRQIAKTTEFRLIRDETGIPRGLFYRDLPFEQVKEHGATYVIYGTSKAVFVDMTARIVEEALILEADRITLLMSEREAAWTSSLGRTDSDSGDWPAENLNQQIHLYSKNLLDA